MCRAWIEVRFVHCDRGLDPELTPEGMAMAHAFAKAYREAQWLNGPIFPTLGW
jgi:hypothetical protein